MGAANAAAGLSQGMPIGASGSRTAVSDSMGVRTQLAGVAAVGSIVAILLFLTDPISYLPAAVLGAVIVSAALGPRRLDGVAGALGDRPRRGDDRRRDDRRRRGRRRAGGARLRRRPLDRGRRPAERPPARRRARLGRAARTLRRRRRPPVGADHAGRRRLPARRPPLLRQRRLRQGTRARGGARRAGAGRAASSSTPRPSRTSTRPDSRRSPTCATLCAARTSSWSWPARRHRCSERLDGGRLRRCRASTRPCAPRSRPARRRRPHERRASSGACSPAPR